MAGCPFSTVNSAEKNSRDVVNPSKREFMLRQVYTRNKNGQHMFRSYMIG